MLHKSIYLFLIILLVPLYFFAPQEMDKGIMALVLVIVFGSTIFFFLHEEKKPKLKNQFLKHSTFAIIGILIVHFQYYIDYLIGNIPSSHLDVWVSRSIVLKSMVLSSIGLLCFFLGYIWFKQNVNFSEKSTEEKTYSVKILVFFAAVALGAFFYTANPLYFAGFYGLVPIGQAAKYARLIFGLLVFAVIIQSCRNLIIRNKIPKNFINYVNYLGWPLVVLLVIYLAAELVSGNRGPLIVFSLCYYSGYFIVTKKKLSIKKGLLYLFFGAMALTTLGVARGYNQDLSFTESLQRGFQTNLVHGQVSFLPQTKELAGSVKSLHYAVAYVPSHHDFMYGRFQFQQIVAIIPFFNSSFLPLIFEDASPKYGTSAAFITWIILGSDPSSGKGTTVIADFYLDFGLIGVIIGMFLFGFFMRYVELALFTTSMPMLFIHTLCVVYLCSALYISRSSVLFELRTVVWIYVVLVLNKELLNR